MISQRNSLGLPQCVKRILLALITVMSYRPTSASDAVVGRHGYASEWAIHVPGGSHVADKVADDLGFYNTGQVSGIVSVFILWLLPFSPPKQGAENEIHN